MEQVEIEVMDTDPEFYKRIGGIDQCSRGNALLYMLDAHLEIEIGEYRITGAKEELVFYEDDLAPYRESNDKWARAPFGLELLGNAGSYGVAFVVGRKDDDEISINESGLSFILPYTSIPLMRYGTSEGYDINFFDDSIGERLSQGVSAECFPKLWTLVRSCVVQVGNERFGVQNLDYMGKTYKIGSEFPD